jgi:peptide-methionine (S)-S-oxide reductase
MPEVRRNRPIIQPSAAVRRAMRSRSVSPSIRLKVSYGQILKVYFAVAHDPTQLNRQGPDVGTQYRSATFYADEEQKRIAQAYIDQPEKAEVFPRPVITQDVPLQAFYPAEGYHQDYATLHPHDPSIVDNDLPKVAQLRQQFPDRYVGK